VFVLADEIQAHLDTVHPDASPPVAEHIPTPSSEFLAAHVDPDTPVRPRRLTRARSAASEPRRTGTPPLPPKEGNMPDETALRIVHFTTLGVSGVCGATARTAPRGLTLAYDEQDDAISCPLCRMYVKGLLAGRGAS
jgi:hypothetical protein